ncbi:type 3 dihydrofolate reductase [Alteromonas aestuariivivens]|uniref:Dihydrofolate reductase n=2 Tax=Alteromonas aestuariivivens TaxID=1938339 RepID=A0A3D8MD97_9ALTE|nr:type 3 dihydrofolate reductase [Alteromonas aestuariivivens]
MIAAMAHDRIIGADNAMPWHLPADLRHFKQTTLGKPVIMGRKTYESIGKALPGRTNIVISTRGDYTLNDATVVTSPREALNLVSTLPVIPDEVMIIGGGTIYEAFLPLANRLYLTFIDTEVGGDTRFPDYQAHCGWSEVERVELHPDENNAHRYAFVTLERES